MISIHDKGEVHPNHPSAGHDNVWKKQKNWKPQKVQWDSFLQQHHDSQDSQKKLINKRRRRRSSERSKIKLSDDFKVNKQIQLMVGCWWLCSFPSLFLQRSHQGCCDQLCDLFQALPYCMCIICNARLKKRESILQTECDDNKPRSVLATSKMSKNS